MRRTGLAVAVWIVLISSAPVSPAAPPAAPATRPAFEPTGSYQVRQVRGRQVYVSGRFAPADRDALRQAIELLDAMLLDVDRRLPPDAAAKLRDVPLWVQPGGGRWPGMVYHPSRQWLADNGENPDKAGGIEVGDVRNLLAWTREQPAMLIHELAHAYYDRVLKRDAPDVVAAFEKAKAGGTYDRVLHVGGRRERAYAMNNVDEYFAEGTEAYFATNDFYPFVRAELIEHDPDLARALERVWAAKSR